MICTYILKHVYDINMSMCKYQINMNIPVFKPKIYHLRDVITTFLQAPVVHRGSLPSELLVPQPAAGNFRANLPPTLAIQDDLVGN